MVARKPPADYVKVQPTLDAFAKKLKDLSRDDSLWEVLKINHQRSRYIYEMYYKKKLISKELYSWLGKKKVIDINLIAKWRKQGYENLCCLKCISEKTCICRVPHQNDFKQCVNCGCKGCASSD
ncbi:unnamed protein product [Kuraishia capsulata CBS 1993]|uniref:G10 protein n=1 Tax=Kuraishia capsulata CBS 1993 TaxID=1382522 RepID=W6MHC2_9ASCO|nr:uncharacterized protein KUCA_T00001015001 [Kuraishia capsulata CBS 1993]CDK25048.1 unnamed protein product [Kuraishia capsulata CBS 1993]